MEAKVKVLSLGDSLCKNNMQVLRTKVAQSGLQIDWVGTKTDGPAPDPENECYGGWEAAQVIGSKAPPSWEDPKTPKLSKRLDLVKPEIALVMLGTNDVIRNSKDTLEDSLNRIVNLILVKSPGVKVVVASIPPVTYDPAAAWVQEVNVKIAKLVKTRASRGEKVYYLDMHSRIKPGYVSSDKVHMTELGNQQMADAWLGILKKLLN